MKKTIFVIPLILLLASMTVITLDVSSASGQGSSETLLYINPPSILDPSLVPSSSFTVDLLVSDVEFLYAWQVNLTFNPDVLRCVNVTEGNFLKSQPNGTAGAKRIEASWAIFGWTTIGENIGKNGSGTLATIEFEVLDWGESPITFDDNPSRTYLIAQSEPNRPPNFYDIEFTAQDGFFSNTPVTTLAVSPSVNTADPGESFSVDVTIANVPDTVPNVDTYEVKLGVNRNILQAESVVEGNFLKDWAAFMGTTTFFAFRTDDPDYVYAACTVLGKYEGASGYDGVLFTVTFTVKAPGVSALDIYDSILISDDGTNPPVSHYPPEYVEQDGTFYTSKPVASFTFSPKSYGRPIVGENVTFDASASFDPDGGAIVNYVWNFDDGTPLGSGMIVKHIYQNPSSLTKPYNVTLTVTDDEGTSSTTYKTSANDQVHIKQHDIAITDITIPSKVVFPHEKVPFYVTVVNNGSHLDTFNITTYYDSHPINTVKISHLDVGSSQNITFVWNTVEVPVGTYALGASAYLVDPVTSQYRAGEEADTSDNTLFGTITIRPEVWNYIFEDSYGRGTILRINTKDKVFQFITSNKDYGVRKATFMKVFSRVVVIYHKDNELALETLGMDVQLDFCMAVATDVQTRQQYLLLDKPGPG